MTDPRLADILAQHDRVAIAGGPGTGKSTLAGTVDDRPVLHTDDTKALDWADQPAAIIARAHGHHRMVIEGVQVGRALRKGLAVDAIVILSEPQEARTKKQAAMAKGCDKILAEALALNPHVKIYRR